MFNLEIITQEKTLLKEEVESLYVSTIDGDITVLARHTPYVSILKPGELIIKKGGKDEPFACTGGILEITPEKTVILADSAVRSDDIDEAEAEKAKERAEKLMAGKLESRENAETLATLERALLHLNIAQKRRHHRG
jgi:F-type H+-transporting ATPase subunit epsilon